MMSSQHSVDSRMSSKLSSSRGDCQPRASQLNTSHMSRLSGSQYSDAVDNDMTQDYAALLGEGQQVDSQAEEQVAELAQVFSQTVTQHSCLTLALPRSRSASLSLCLTLTGTRREAELMLCAGEPEQYEALLCPLWC